MWGGFMRGWAARFICWQKLLVLPIDTDRKKNCVKSVLDAGTIYSVPASRTVKLAKFFHTFLNLGRSGIKVVMAMELAETALRYFNYLHNV